MFWIWTSGQLEPGDRERVAVESWNETVESVWMIDEMASTLIGSGEIAGKRVHKKVGMEHALWWVAIFSSSLARSRVSRSVIDSQTIILTSLNKGRGLFNRASTSWGKQTEQCLRRSSILRISWKVRSVLPICQASKTSSFFCLAIFPHIIIIPPGILA